MRNKRKDITPKKFDQGARKKTTSPAAFIDLTLDDGIQIKATEKVSRSLFKKENEDATTADDGEFNSEGDESDDSDSYHSLPPLTFYRNDQTLPVYSKRNPDIEEVFRICLKKEVPPERLVTRKPVRIKDTATFIVNQDLAKVKHPKDLDADDTPGAYTKKESTRYYQVERGEDGELKISCEVHVTKNANGAVVSGIYRQRKGRVWESVCAKMGNVYAVIRKRAVHKATLECYKTAFTRCISWVMPLDEYNRVYSKLRDLKEYMLSCSTIVMHYYFNTGQRVPIVGGKHGNAKQNASSFRPKEHSLKQSCKELVQEDFRAPRLICQEMQEKEDILESFTDSSVLRDPKQLANYRQLYGPTKGKSTDAIGDVIFGLLEQSHDENPETLDENQSFIQELLVRHQKQVEVVGFLQQTLKDIERFCTAKANPAVTSPLCADTTFNVAEYLVTQTTYKQLSVLDKNSLKHPWFPGPLMFHRNQKKEDFSYFWQAVKRGNPELFSLLVLGTDEDEALSGGILHETKGTIHLLGKEHVLANVEKKLVSLNFPLQQRRIILRDVFEGPESLYECQTSQEYAQKVSVFKEKWNEIEEEYTKNRPPCKFTKYFEAHKERQLGTKMIKGVRREANIDGEYGQNPIEWQNFLTKEEIDDFCKKLGQSHSEISITTALAALKNRYFRLYQNLVKAIYNEGPYMLSPPFSQFSLTYDEWKEKSRDDKSRHIKAFMSYVPTPAVLRRLEDASRSDSSRLAGLTTEDAAGTNVLKEPAQDDPQEPTEVQGMRRLVITAEEADIPEECVNLGTLQDIFRKAESLLNDKGAIMQAASNEERMRTVKSKYGLLPLIVKPQTKNKNLFECNCKLYKGIGICADTVAVAEDNGVLFDYIEALRKKFKRTKQVPNLTAAIEANQNVAERGHKQNEVQRIRRRMNQKSLESCTSTAVLPSPVTSGNATNASLRGMPSSALNSNVCGPGANTSSPTVPCFPPSHGNFQSQGLPASTHSMYSTYRPGHLPGAPSSSYEAFQQLHLPDTTPSSHSAFQSQGQMQHPQVAPYSMRYPMPVSQSVTTPLISGPAAPSSTAIWNTNQTQIHPTMTYQQQWHAGMSPSKYEVVLLPRTAQKCYGCGQNFADKYRRPPNNLVVRHVDRRIRGRSADGSLFYSPDFTNTYYHLSKEHVLRKNPEFNGNIFLGQQILASLSLDQQHVLQASGLNIVLG